ncbi:MAG: hypothetical protein KAU20_05615 [Nanoarchaeota archaeon]|nr:hypothetical protein [Nanoarchaeota archaeon]
MNRNEMKTLSDATSKEWREIRKQAVKHNFDNFDNLEVDLQSYLKKLGISILIDRLNATSESKQDCIIANKINLKLPSKKQTAEQKFVNQFSKLTDEQKTEIIKKLS